MLKKAKKKKKPVIYHTHTTYEDFKGSVKFSNELAPIIRFWAKKLYNAADYLISPTEYTKNLIETKYLLNKKEVRVISNGVNTDKFCKNEELKNKFLAEYKINKALIITAGLPFERKGIKDFVEIVKKVGIKKFIIHARIAVLAGLDTKQNREIPPLRYDEVYKIKKEMPDLYVEINGGIKTVEEIDKHLEHVDSVMIGRQIYENPMILTQFGKYYGKNIKITREEIIEKMIKYVEKIELNGIRPHLFLMHTHGLFFGQKGSKFWKRAINNPKADSFILKNLLKELKNERKI